MNVLTKLDIKEILRKMSINPIGKDISELADTIANYKNFDVTDVESKLHTMFICDNDIIMDCEANKEQINSSRKPIKSAVDGGWEVDSSDANKALDMWVEYVGEDNALEDLAQATGDDNLREDIEWISRQFGVAEELEQYDSVWDKHNELRELIGVHEYFENLWRAMGSDELAACLAFIFRQNDFQQWDDENGIYQSKQMKNLANVHKLYSSVSEAGYNAHEIMTFPEFQSYVRSIVEPVEMFDYKSAYFVIVETEAEADKLSRRLSNEFGVLSSTYSLQDPHNEFYGKWQVMC